MKEQAPRTEYLSVHRKMAPDDVLNELDTPLIDCNVEQMKKERHPFTPNSNQSTNSPNTNNPRRDTSFSEVESTATESSAKLSHLNQNVNQCHHHLCYEANSHAHQQRNQRQSRRIESSGTASVGENQNQNQQNIYTNHPDDQSDSDGSLNVPKLPNRPQTMKLPCRNRCTGHEHHHQNQHHNHLRNDT